MTAQIGVIDIDDNNNDVSVEAPTDASVEAPTETNTTDFVAPVEEVKQKK